MRASKRCVLALALGGAGCSLGDFGYLSADFGGGGAPAAGNAGAMAAGSGAGSAGEGGGAGASAGSGGTTPDHYFCASKYALFDPSKAQPPAQLPADGDYVVRKYTADSPTTNCLLTPDWPELGDQRYYAITEPCGGPGTPQTAQASELWHFERICSDVYRLTSGHATPSERQLGVTDHTMDGTPLYSVESTRSVDPSLLFQLRFEERIPAGGPGAPVDQPLERWRLSPLIQASSCVEQISKGRYGELEVARVVLYPCTGSMPNQSWSLLPVP